MRRIDADKLHELLSTMSSTGRTDFDQSVIDAVCPLAAQLAVDMEKVVAVGYEAFDNMADTSFRGVEDAIHAAIAEYERQTGGAAHKRAEAVVRMNDIRGAVGGGYSVAVQVVRVADMLRSLGFRVEGE